MMLKNVTFTQGLPKFLYFSGRKFVAASRKPLDKSWQHWSRPEDADLAYNWPARADLRLSNVSASYRYVDVRQMGFISGAGYSFGSGF